MVLFDNRYDTIKLQKGNKRGFNMSNRVILTCSHCGNKTPMNLLNRYVKSTYAEFAPDYVAYF